MNIEDIGGILTYTTSGHNKPCGQTIGANGAGTFSIIFIGDSLSADEKAREHIKILQGEGHRITEAVFVANEETAFGKPILIK